MLVLANGFLQAGSVDVTVQAGQQVLAAGVFDDLFPYTAVTVSSPAAGAPVRVGDPIMLALPAPSLDSTLAAARFYWTDLPAGAPPYHTFQSATVAAGSTTFQTTAPSTTGHAILNVQGRFGSANFAPATSCRGFQYCDGLQDWEDAGPVAIDVVP